MLRAGPVPVIRALMILLPFCLNLHHSRSHSPVKFCRPVSSICHGHPSPISGVGMPVFLFFDLSTVTIVCGVSFVNVPVCLLTVC